MNVESLVLHIDQIHKLQINKIEIHYNDETSGVINIELFRI